MLKDTQEINSKQVFLQILTSGFKTKFDEAYAYGILEKDKNGEHFIIKIKDSELETNFFSFLEEKRKEWIENNTSVYMFNGFAESKILSKHIGDFHLFYQKNVKDLFSEIKKIQFFLPKMTLSLKNIANLKNNLLPIKLGPEIYKEHFPFKTETAENFLISFLKNNLLAIQDAKSVYFSIYKKFVNNNNDFITNLKDFKFDSHTFTIQGVNKPGKATFFHSEYVIYEEEAQGNFQLSIDFIENKYSDDDTCYALPFPYPIKNPIKMPLGFFLLAYNSQVYIQQVHEIIKSIRQHTS